MMPKISTIFLLIIVFVNLHFGQNDYEKKYIQLIPGAQYEAGGLHEFIFGAHWRDAWTAPVNVEILDLQKFAGGLTPLKRGGGFQTKSLRLRGNDGHIWKFRSMAKDPAKILPKILRKTFVADIFQDQISSANPLAALVAAPLLEAVGILQAKPYLVYMPDDPLLGEFREDFGGVLGMIEIHPDVDIEEGLEFEGADKIKSTFKLLDRLAEKGKEKVDDTEYLKARLIDVFLGDWDRHTDQWKWARYDKHGKSYWHPIPRDRDQVFAKWDGLGPSIAEYLVPQFVHFNYEYPPIEDITWSGRFIDRRFLTELTRAEWDSVANFVVEKLTDQVIEDAVSALPTEQYKIAAEEIIGKLKSRRDLLAGYAIEYYNLINKVVDIYGTDKDDIVEVSRLSDKNTRVEIFDIKKKSGNKKIHYSKLFDNSITKEIRIYCLDEDDSVIVKGEVNDSPLIRAIAGDGKDILIDSSKVNGYLFSVLPIPHAERKTEFYDSGKKTTIIKGAGTYFNDEKIPEPKDYYEKYEPQLRDRSVNWLVSPVVSFNSNDGLRIGGGMQLFGYNFRMDPYEYWMNATVDYATNPQSFTFNFNGIYNSVIKGSTVTLDIQRSELLFTNYYGFGNETTYDEDLEAEEFYRIDEDLILVESAIHLNYFGDVNGGVGFQFKRSDLEVNNELLLSAFNSEYGLNGFNQLKFYIDLNLDTRDNRFYPEKGFYANLRGSIYPEIFDNEETFFKAEASAAFFTTLKTFTDFTFAIKAGGGSVFGNKYPYFESIFIGGGDDLRGFSRRRFSGDSGVHGQFELRSFLFPMKLIFPGKFGIHGFIESGRVYDDLFKNSEKWHPSYGGGIWMTFIDKSVSTSLSIAKSTETTAFYFALGMGF